MSSTGKTLNEIYQKLYSHFGHQNWWPGESLFEICVGAILTQNTAWTNVEKAVKNLSQAGLMDFQSLYAAPDHQIAQLIRPAGYFNIKTKRLRNFLNAIKSEYQDFESLSDLSMKVLRERLLSIKGIGPETADSMVLYAFHKPSFVIDSYTKRVLVRHSLIDQEADYYQMKELFESNLESDVNLFNDYHAQIVMVGKHFCLKSRPRCEECPLQNINGGPILV